ncbi:MAG TPA: malto-oligosyltrehalose trehalohydrolase, partial [Reyranellaceae bacterium]|nr:malto-oligosyltrehalose trehalohydrolase [Reyranellaceae bacterium]
MSAFARRLPFGATWLGDGRTRFRLWAPAQENLLLELGETAPLAMQRAEGGWFEIEVTCPPGTRYRYRLANGLSI